MNSTSYCEVGSVRRRRTKHAVLVGLAVATCLSTMAVQPSVVSAAPVVSRSPVIRNDPLAAVAAQALADLQELQVSPSSELRSKFTLTRDSIATVIAARVGVDPDRMIQAWVNADQQHQEALLAALAQLGVSYRRNMSKAGVGFDCSGLTSHAWGIAGVALAHQSRTQINNTAPRSFETAQAGDLVYYPGHISMYLGVDMTIVHAPNTGRTVEVSHIRNGKKVRFSNPAG